MIFDLSEIYEIKHTDEYRNADSIWFALKDGDRFKLEPLVGKKIYSMLVFINRVMEPLLGNNCDLAYDCKEHGFSYYIGNYFQKREYSTVDNITYDIDTFKSLLNIYDKDKYPEEIQLIDKIIDNLSKFVERCKTYELYYEKI